MTFVVSESCIRCKYTDCVVVCPTDAFREGPNFLAIEPDDCIDYAVCVPECPVNAIYADEDVPPEQAHFIALNVELERAGSPSSKRKPLRPTPTRGPASQTRPPCWSIEESEPS